MSFACAQNYLAQQFFAFQPKNGECRFLAAPSDEETSEQGFISDEFTARTAEFIQCSWMPKESDKSAADSDVAAQTRSVAIYEVTIVQTIDGIPTVCLPSDRIELRTRIGDASSLITCEIVRRVNQNNMSWLLDVVNLDDNQ